MATPSGLASQIGYAVESTYGTGVTVTRFLPLVSETLKREPERIESAGIISGRHVLDSSQWAQGNATVSGDVQHELHTQDMGMLLRAAFGTVTTTGSGPYTHVFWPVDPSVSLTCQVGRPTTYGSVLPFTYTGCKIQSWELAAAAGEFATWGMSLIGQDETQGTALATASYTTNNVPWSFSSMNLKIATVTIPVKSFSLSGENSLTDDRRFLGGTTISEPLRQDLAAYTGELAAEWGNPSAQGTLNYLRFVGGTEAALNVVMTSGTMEGTIQAQVRYDGATPNVAGRGVLEHTIPFKCVGTLDASALTVTIKNNNATA